jgi:hypothetical protein
MNTNKKLRNIVLVCAGVAAVITIIILFNITTGNDGDTAVVKKNVSVIGGGDNGDEGEGGIEPAVVTDDELIFYSDPGYPDGEVLVAEIIDAAPSGFIRKVVETTKEGDSYIVKTEPGLLADVFEQAHIKKSFALTEDGAVEIDPDSIDEVSGTANVKNNSLYAYAEDFTIGEDFEISAGIIDEEVVPGISVTCAVRFRIWVDVEIDINPLGRSIFGIVAHETFDGEASVVSSIGDEFEKELKTLPLRDIIFWVVGVPIVIKNELQVSIEGETHLDGPLDASFKIGSDRSIGFRYDSDAEEIEEINEKKDSAYADWDTESSVAGSVKAGIYLHYIGKLYDIVGPDISAGVYGLVEGKLSVNPDKSSAEKYVGYLDKEAAPEITGHLLVEVDIPKKVKGIPIPIIGGMNWTLVDITLFEKSFGLFWEDHWDSGADWEQKVAELTSDNDDSVASTGGIAGGSTMSSEVFGEFTTILPGDRGASLTFSKDGTFLGSSEQTTAEGMLSDSFHGTFSMMKDTETEWTLIIDTVISDYAREISGTNTTTYSGQTFVKPGKRYALYLPGTVLSDVNLPKGFIELIWHITDGEGKDITIDNATTGFPLLDKAYILYDDSEADSYIHYD